MNNIRVVTRDTKWEMQEVWEYGGTDRGFADYLGDHAKAQVAGKAPEDVPWKKLNLQFFAEGAEQKTNVQLMSNVKIEKKLNSLSGTYSGADNIAEGAKLKEYYRRAEKHGTDSIHELDDGRIRFYEKIKPAKTEGEMAGARLVEEWNPDNGNIRVWYETLDHFGNIRQVRPDPRVTGGVKVHYGFDASGKYIGNWIPRKWEVYGYVSTN